MGNKTSRASHHISHQNSIEIRSSKKIFILDRSQIWQILYNAKAVNVLFNYESILIIRDPKPIKASQSATHMFIQAYESSFNKKHKGSLFKGANDQTALKLSLESTPESLPP